jgi:Cellulase (glycosyl hydrolase family 5)
MITTTLDSVQQRAITELQSYTSWLTGNGLSISANGFVEEIGWPGTQSQAVNPADSPLWNAVGNLYLRELDSLSLGGMFWWTGVGSIPVWILSLYAPRTQGGILGTSGTTVQAQASTFEGHPSFGSVYRGVNVAPDMINSSNPYWATGGPPPITAGGVFSNFNPGVAGTDYWIPDSSSIAWLARRGHKILRLAISWEILQPTFFSALRTTYLAGIRKVIAAAHKNGMATNITLFNSSGYYVGGKGTTNVSLNTVGYSSSWTEASSAALSDLWSRLSSALADTPGLLAYNVLNEPHTQPEGTTSGLQLSPDSGFESDTVGQPPPSCLSINCSALIDDTHAHSGSNAVKLTATTEGQCTFFGAEFAVTAGNYYVGQAWFYANASSAIANLSVAVSWYDASHNFKYSTFGFNTNDALGYWLSGRVVAAAPSGASYARISVYIYTSLTPNQYVWLDDMSVWQCRSIVTKEQVWANVSQGAIDAIRANDTTTEIWLNNYWGNPNWLSYYPGGPWATDPANKLRYAFHHYWDHASSSGGVYAATYASELLADTSVGF